MPDKPYDKIKPPSLPVRRAPRHPIYAEFLVTTNFSFLRGASHPEEYIATAAELGYAAIGVADQSTLAGIVRAHTAARDIGMPYRPGARLALIPAETPPTEIDPAQPIESQFQTLNLAVFPINRAGYGNLCSLLTLGKTRLPGARCLLTTADFLRYHAGLAVIVVPPRPLTERGDAPPPLDAARLIGALLESVTDRSVWSIALTKNYDFFSPRAISLTRALAHTLGLPLLATNDVHYHVSSRRPLHDVLTAIREGGTVQTAGFKLFPNGERYLKPVEEMGRLFRDEPHALTRTLELLEMTAGFSLDELRYEYPTEICPEGHDAHTYLAEKTWAGAKERYPNGVPPKVAHAIDDELRLIKELTYEKYFLTCHDIVVFARSRGILCQGRGAAANSVVCYCLGITSVDPATIDLLFARFVSKERNEPPDIDIDFEHERREEVIQYIYTKYGRHRAGLTCAVITYRYRSAIREVGKALGLSLEIVDKLAKLVHRWTDCIIAAEDLRALGLEPTDATIQNAIRLSHELLGFPRHLSQHVGGFIISQEPLSETVPIRNSGMEDRTIIEWDKDDIDALGMLKIDVLALGMLTCIRKALDLVNARRQGSGNTPLELHSIPPNDSAVYDMICRADTVGVFQIESRAQMSMLPRLRPRCFYDLVIEVAIVRPGPIHGNMVHPYLKRRSGKEKVHFPDEQVKAILGKTLGVPLFQEQAMRLAIVLADFSPGEAEKLRRAMAAWKRNKEVIATFKQKIVAGMTRNGYSVKFAETCMEQIKGFSEYGFPESHAASFALLVYASAWLKHHYPAEFATALLNSQPMGFYAPAQIVRDAQDHGVCVREADIAYSGWDTRLEEDDTSRRPAVRLGLRLFKGLPRRETELLVDSRERHPTSQTIEEFWLNVTHDYTEAPERPYRSTLQIIARGDGFYSFGLTRREALWAIKALPEIPLPIDRATIPCQVTPPARTFLPASTTQQEMFADYAATGLSLKGHPIGFIRHELDRRRVSSAQALRALTRLPRDRTVAVAGVAIIRQRPGTAKGVVFITLEDETGITNLIIRPEVFEKYRRIVLASSSLLATGSLERIGEVIYINTTALEAIDDRIAGTPQETNSYSYR
jgi:error-prone DNA polymerase